MLAATALLLGASVSHAEGRIVAIPAGRFAPLFGIPDGWSDLPVAGFRLDATPVTVDEFKAFIKGDATWSAQQARGSIYADKGYLAALEPEAKPQPKAPATTVSWFAARAFCQAKGARLPTTLEWEYAAAATATRPDGVEDPEMTAAILAWYARPTGNDALRAVGSGRPNFYGAYDLHGLIWEWTDDFNAAFVASDSRSQSDRVQALVCGAGAMGAARPTDYAAFMRYAFRGSLAANFNQPNLGFRCAYDPL